MKKNRVFFIILFVAAALFMASRVSIETDYLWHIKAGEYMFKNGPLTHDVFSWIVNGKYWMSHEWLFEVFIYTLKLVFGNYHLIIYPFITILSLFLLMYLPNKDNFSKNIFYTLPFLFAIFLMLLGGMQVRPHLISFSLLAATIYLLYDLYKNEKSKKIYLLPLITILWANVHGGSSNLSYILCLIFLICGLFKFKLKKFEAEKFTKRQLITYLVISILCMVSVCINIHGFKMFIYPYENMMDTTMLSNIAEWQPTSLTVLNHYIYILYSLFIIITMLSSRKKIRFLDFILLGFVTFLGLKSIRFWIYSPIVMSFIIFDYVKEDKVEDKILSMFSIALCCLIAVVMISAINLKVDYQVYLNKKVIKIIKEEKPKRLFNMYNYGGELIYHNIKVFADGRADLYSKYNLKDYFDISNGKDNCMDLIDKYDFDYLLIDKEYPIYNHTKKRDYEIIYENKKFVLYKK